MIRLFVRRAGRGRTSRGIYLIRLSQRLEIELRAFTSCSSLASVPAPRKVEVLLVQSVFHFVKSFCQLCVATKAEWRKLLEVFLIRSLSTSIVIPRNVDVPWIGVLSLVHLSLGTWFWFPTASH
jgi:hypothetical protein